MSAPGSMAAHDDLCVALEAWRSAEDDAGARVAELKAAAINCGMSADEPAPVAWIKRRVETYRREFVPSAETLRALVAERVDRFERQQARGGRS